jgi:hypothetical protein
MQYLISQRWLSLEGISLPLALLIFVQLTEDLGHWYWPLRFHTGGYLLGHSQYDLKW